MADAPTRLPDDISLGPVRLQVADLGRSLAWYEGVMGFRVLRRREGGAELGGQGEDTPLLSLNERPGAAPAGRRRSLGLYHFAILLPYRAALGRFVAHLPGTGVRVGASDHLVSEALYLSDPDGLGIEVYADRPRATWRWQAGELLMSTDPLDLEDLRRAAGDTVWAGMPPGTRVGHLHLHVGSLDEAVRFYQQALGLEPTVRSYPGALFLSAGGYHHHLGLNTWAGPSASPPGESDARLLEWSILVPRRSDADQAASRMTEAGYRAVAAGGGWTISDPWGTVLRLGPRDEH